MYKARVFVSYRKRNRPQTLIDTLEAALEREGFEILRDEPRLNAGDAWRTLLHTWLNNCNGAVILFTEEALEESQDNNWVTAEATVLGSRKYSLGDRFPLVPICVGVDPNRLSAARFEPVRLGEIQAIETLAAPDDAPACVALVEKVVNAFKPLKHAFPTSFEAQAASDVEQHLEQTSEAAVRDCLEELDVVPEVDVKPQLAFRLVRATPKEIIDTIGTLRERDVLTSAAATAIVTRIWPFTWVDPTSARHFYQSVCCRQASAFLSMDSRATMDDACSFAANMHRRRADTTRYEVIPVEARIDDGVSLTDQLKAQLASRLFDGNLDRLNRSLEKKIDRGRRYIVELFCTDSVLISDTALATLRDDPVLKRIGIVLIVAFAHPHLRLVERLNPEFDPDEEADAKDGLEDALDISG